jgi:hypothetical protein
MMKGNVNISKANENKSPRNTSWKADETFLSKRAILGKTWIVDLGGSSSAEILFMRTFQGSINRNVARLYLINSDHERFGAAEQFWIEEYERQGWVEIEGRLTIDEVLQKFGSESKGYVAATEKEPWSIHAATVIAILKNGIVAPDDVAIKLKKLGWKELDNVCGRWSDAVSAYNEMVNQHREDLAYPGLALVRPGEGLWDFIVQQQIMPVFTRPKHDTWEGVAKIMDAYPGKHILYGYVSDDTVEEEIAVERASSSGKYLVPTHEVSNLSYHSAVLGNSPLLPVEQKSMETIPGLDPSQVNVAIAITDGDNLQVPILQYPLPKFWNTEKRGSLPLGWSMGVSLSTLAPGIWEYYRKSIRPNDEIVSIMGIAYVHASTLPEPLEYFDATFSSMTDMGLHTLWSLDSSLTITDEPLWDMLENSPARNVLEGVLVGYGPSIDKAFRRDTGTPVMITQNGYSEDANRIKERIEAIIAMDPSERSPVNFFMATNWSTNAEDLYKTLKPLEDKGVRFLKPLQALALMPEIRGRARSSVEIAAAPGLCLPTGFVEQYGSPILSSPILAEINNPIPIPIIVAVEGPKETRFGQTLECTANIEIDVNHLAAEFLDERVLPVVEGYGLSEEFAELAWMLFTASGIQLELPLSEHMTGGDVIQIISSDRKVSAVFVDHSLRITLDAFSSDSRVSYPSIRLSVIFSVNAPSKGNHEFIQFSIKPETVTFNFSLTVGIGEEDGPLVGGIKGKMKGTGARPLIDVVLCG